MLDITGFTQLNLERLTFPSETSFTSSLDGGTVYQIAIPNVQKSNETGKLFFT